MYRKGQLILRPDEEKLKINIFKAFKFQNRLDFCIQIDVSDAAVIGHSDSTILKNYLKLVWCTLMTCHLKKRKHKNMLGT